MIHSTRLIVAAIFILLGCTHRSEAQSDLSADPFEVRVVVDGGYARCGPSSDSYRTDRLDCDQRLMVYLQTNDGWLGVQPLKNSFCWVPADAIELSGSEQTGKILEDRTAVWIGTHLKDKPKHQWQVKLGLGEAVSIIGKSNRQGPDGPQLWYRIVPPSGEYRWVHRDQVNLDEVIQSRAEELSVLERSAEIPVAEQPQTAPKPAVDPRNEQQKQRGLFALFGRSRQQETDHASAQRPATGPSSAIAKIGARLGIGLRTAPRNVAAQAARQTTNPIEQASYPQRIQPTASGSPIAFAPAPRPSPTVSPAPAPTLAPAHHVSAARNAQIRLETQNANLDQLSLLLSKLMSNQASAAETQPVVEAARRHGSSSPDAAGRAAELAERAEQYAELAMRREAARTASQSAPANIAMVSAARSSAGPSLGRPSLAVPNSSVPNSSVPNLSGPSFSGPAFTGAVQVEPTKTSMSGRLVPVYSVRADSPPFALTDGVGRTVAYVKPVPGINLRNHVNRNVTVHGKLMYVAGIRTPVIQTLNAVQNPR